MIWKREVTLDALNAMGEGNMVGLLDIRFEHIGDDTLAGYLCTQGEQKVVGLEVNANHVRSAREGRVRGICKAIHTGSRHQVWQIDIYDEQQRLCCTSRLTTAVV